MIIAGESYGAKSPVDFPLDLGIAYNMIPYNKGLYPIYEPATDKVFNEEIKKHLRPEIDLKELDIELNSPELTNACVDVLADMMYQESMRAVYKDAQVLNEDSKEERKRT